MPDAIIMCDRCKITVQGWIDRLTLGLGGTAGFYNVKNTHWEHFAYPDEFVVCDSCMWSDARYIAEYGKHK